MRVGLTVNCGRPVQSVHRKACRSDRLSLFLLTVEGSTELIEIGYEAGFGARNSMGFGMAE
jgi:CRISPR-associated endoribonuclease Cas6